ncbi:hypothetical protein J6590_094273 [Homalodisca vitripennis]|nr:hypothetical protein J6590_094273 [Homalodisca vitripennis]
MTKRAFWGLNHAQKWQKQLSARSWRRPPVQRHREVPTCHSLLSWSIERIPCVHFKLSHRSNAHLLPLVSWARLEYLTTTTQRIRLGSWGVYHTTLPVLLRHSRSLPPNTAWHQPAQTYATSFSHLPS